MLKYLGLTFLSLIALLGCDEKKVALLFLTVNELNHPGLWERQLKDDPHFSVYVHSKNEMQNPFFAKYRIANIVPTSWSRHMRAWQELLREAVKDPANTKFVFLSDSCIPLSSLNEIYQRLTQDNLSSMRFRQPWWDRRGPREIEEIPEAHRFGNGEWVILNRRYAELIANDDLILPLASQHEMDVESYHSSLFSYHGCLEDPELCNRESTFAKWDQNENHPYQYQGKDNPYLFCENNGYNLELLKEAKNKGFFFARKISASFPEEVLEELMHVKSK